MTLHSVELLEQVIESARNSGIHIRQEYLAGISGGLCKLGGRQILFIDLSLPAADQLKQVIEALNSPQLKVAK